MNRRFQFQPQLNTRTNKQFEKYKDFQGQLKVYTTMSSFKGKYINYKYYVMFT